VWWLGVGTFNAVGPRLCDNEVARPVIFHVAIHVVDGDVPEIGVVSALVCGKRWVGSSLRGTEASDHTLRMVRICVPVRHLALMPAAATRSSHRR